VRHAPGRGGHSASAGYERCGFGAPAATIDLQITVVQGGITNAKVPVVIGARYDGLPFAGPTRLSIGCSIRG
jgi:hypothetical protein